jgi:NitT/TauT family transport system ATP-binding protein
MLVGRDGAARPDPAQAAWLYSQMVRWGQTSLSADALRTAMGVFRPDIYDQVLGRSQTTAQDGIGAFAGPPFDPDDIVGHLSAFAIGRWKA